MNTILYPCPNPACKERHALCWFHMKRKKVLGVICNQNGDGNKFFKLEQSKIDCIDEGDLAGIPEHFTPEAKKSIEAKGNLQLNLMNPQSGEVVERNVQTMSEDDKKARQLLGQIEQLKQAQAEVAEQIANLVRKQQGLEKTEREVRTKLREVWTEPLNLTT